MLVIMEYDNLALRPNCLLTKYPIVFITGPRSLFFYKNLSVGLQDYIAAHGYQVLSPQLPFRGELRKLALEPWLKKFHSPIFHFVVGEKTKSEFSEIFSQYPGSTFTLTDSFVDSFSEKLSTPISYNFHKWFCGFYGVDTEAFKATFPDNNVLLRERFLDRCIELAENE